MAARKKATAKKKTPAKKKAVAATRKKKAKAGASKKSIQASARKKKTKATATKKATAARKRTAVKAAVSKEKPRAARKKAASAKKTPRAPAARKAGKKNASAAKSPRKTRAKSAPAAVEPLAPGRAVIAFSGTEIRSKLGEKWTCFNCNVAFYDLGRKAKICPKCGANQAEKPKPGSTPAPKVAARSARRRAARPMAPLLEEDDDAVRYNEEFDLGIQENAGDDEDSPGTGAQNLFPDSGDADEPDEPDEPDEE